nr:MAG TPA: Lines C-terminus [Caudoviricetes sp.]
MRVIGYTQISPVIQHLKFSLKSLQRKDLFPILSYGYFYQRLTL